jgi:predicted secreted protein
MTIGTGIAVYVVIWWLVLFTVLPWGTHAVENPEPGHATSAPARPRIALKFAITTGIATVVFLIFLWIQQSGLIQFGPS